MANVFDVADYILSLADEDAGDLISNLKIQKLAYYCQGFHLALNGGIPLFPEQIQAWEHGPVVVDLYRRYSGNGANALTVSQSFDSTCLTENERELIEEVYSVYGQFSAWKLRNMTHEEAPWVNTGRNEIITNQVMQEYFSTQVNA